MSRNNIRTNFTPKTFFLTTRDGQKIQVCIYQPLKSVECNLIIHNQIDWTQKSYFSFCNFLCQHGIRVITFDPRGIGNSKTHQKKMALNQWAKLDLDSVILFVKNQYPKNELIYLGHGLSAQLVGLAPASLFFDKLIFINAEFSKSGWSSMKRWIILFWKNLKHKQLPAGILQELLKWNGSFNGLFSFHSSINYRKFQIPFLICNFLGNGKSKRRNIKSLMFYFFLSNAEYLNFKSSFLSSPHSNNFINSQVEVQKSSWLELVAWCLR